MNHVSTQARANTSAEGAVTERKVVETRFIASPATNVNECHRVSTNVNERHIMPRHISMTNETQR